MGRAAVTGTARPTAPRTVQLSLSGDLTGCGQARAFTERALLDWGLDQCIDDALTVVSELTANAMLHARRCEAGGERETEVRLRLTRRPAHLVCAVTDRSDAVPVSPHAPDSFQEHGRGLFMVEALAQHWGWTRYTPSGKTVWAILPTEAPA
ncbi:ATP-binding protein [Streptomyces gilvifuscus]|uniref:ATP-binding protein n=1 Tax=Streptomyces gilvifuscus TaxID=1550617 RepID=A0ABT5G8A8_9ACTN|nr:ATP-binding protein [Streptomyces gilvifuscus]MDC2960994.1 ATP-binding protein [Streptomyces gilvifuscus]